jgi:mRNA interferase RelE/StbE
MQNIFCGYKLVIGKKAQKALESLDTKIQCKIIEKLKTLVSQEHSLNIKKLEGYENLFRIKIGSYRIVYEPIHNVITIYVITIGLREGFYQEFKKYYKN